MAKYSITARAKLNLALDILRRRTDGYHELRMVMQSVALGDTLTVEEVSGAGITLTTNLRYLPRDGRNLAVSAARLFFESNSIRPRGLRIILHKRIPVTAGLGGGSADAAAMLRLLNRMYGAGLSAQELCALGRRLGSDVPYCVLGGTALAEGIGDVLTPLPDMPRCHVLICRPPFSISTPYMFSKIDAAALTEHPDTDGMLAAIRAGSLPDIACRLYNVMEGAAVSEHPEIREIRESMYDLGAVGAVMSGSGPTVFGLFDSGESARTAYARIRAQYTETHLTEVCGQNTDEDIVRI